MHPSPSRRSWPFRSFRLVALCALLAPACRTAPLDAGWRAFHHDDDAGALQAWQPLAEEGDADAQYLVGLLHDEGRGPAFDPRLAASWYAKAAAQGHPAALNNLGLLFHAGAGVPCSPEFAAALYMRAAEQGLPSALNNLAVLYLQGEVVPQSRDTARGLLRRAAKGGDVHARRTLHDEFGEDVVPRPDARSDIDLPALVVRLP